MIDVVDTQSQWLTETLIRLNRLAVTSIEDADRIALARRLVRFAEIDDSDFPVPAVFRAKKGFLHLHWTAPYDDSSLEFMIASGCTFQGMLWLPGVPNVVRIVRADHVNEARKLMVKFWPTAHETTKAEMFQLAGVK